MKFYPNDKSFTKVVPYLEVIAISILLIGFDHIKPTSAFPISAERRDNDYRDLTLSIEEKKTLELFKDRVGHRLPEAYMNTDFYLIRWIRTAEYNIEQAETLLMETLQWREDNQIGTILTEDFSDVSEDYLITTNTCDKTGRPIVAVNMGSWDLRAAALQGKLARVTRYLYWSHEILVSQVFEAQQFGQNVTRAVFLVDLDGYNLLQHLCSSCLAFQIKFATEVQAYYPMFWESFVAINTPSIFDHAMKAAKGVMKPEFKKTLKVFPHNKKKWIAYLDDKIDRDQRYTNYGGTRQLIDY